MFTDYYVSDLKRFIFNFSFAGTFTLLCIIKICMFVSFHRHPMKSYLEQFTGISI